MDASPFHAVLTASLHPQKKRKHAPITPNASTHAVAEHQESIFRVSTSPVFPPGSNYQVFLSFRGEDIRTGFADHLYRGFVNAGICVFRDENNLHIGGEIDPELHRAISESKIFIPILSQGYASSKWCLEELTRAIALKKSSGHIVLPIFYKVKPSHVRYQIGNFGKAFNSLRKRYEPKFVDEWEQALKDLTSMKGWESEKIANGYEAELVKLVVEAVLGELKQDFQLDVPERLVGIDDHMEEILRLINSGSHDTRMIGIYGMGGIGKTTLAKCIFNKLSNDFVHFSFIIDGREKTRRNGIEYLQKQLISDILKSDTHVYSVDDGISIIKSRFRGKKVLILIDDVDDKRQLDDLTRERHWFGLGSRIIVTTRDKEVLEKAKFGVDYMYELQELNQEPSLWLFSMHAFREGSPLNEFRAISREIVKTTGGLPLALEVIGSFLFGVRDMGVWTDTLKKLRSAPAEQVQEKLKISYDALDYESKQIFLDIACFFIGMERTLPMYMWDDLNFTPRMRIQILMHKSLIKIEENMFTMHDQLRDLGRAIISEEDYDEPKNRSRLWHKEDVWSVLDKHEGSEKIRAIRMVPPRSVYYQKEVFEKLPNLRMFHSSNVALAGDFQNSFSELRWLHLEWFFACESSNLHADKLVILELAYDSITNDWAGWNLMKMPRLKVLLLYCCKTLQNSPDLSLCKNLEIVQLQKCPFLECIHPSIGRMKNLISLNLFDCYKLKELPIEMRELQELKELIIDSTAIGEISEWIASLKKLEILSAQWCRQLARIPQSIGHLVNLSYLNFRFCEHLVQVPCSFRKLESLTELDISFTRIAKFPEGIGSAQNLRLLHACDSHLEGEIPSEIGNLCSLKILHLSYTRISSLPKTISNLSSLQVLDLEGCCQLGSLPKLPSNLTSLRLSCQSITLPRLSHLNRLKELKLQNCKSLKFIPDLPSSLSNIVISGCNKLEKLPNLSGLKLLTKLEVFICESLEFILDLPPNLLKLVIIGCDKLEKLPNLSSLKLLIELELRCSKLTEIIGLEGLKFPTRSRVSYQDIYFP